MLREDAINAFSGSIAGLVAAIITCPIDMVKIRLQNKSSKSSTLLVFQEIWKSAGLKGLYRGVGPTVAGYLPTWALYFYVYGASKKFYKSIIPASSPSHNEVLQNIISALQAGTVSTIATNPLWVVRTRIMTQSVTSTSIPPQYSSSAQATAPSYYYRNTREALRTIWKNEGWRALYKGLGPSLIGVSHVVIQFPIYEHLKKLHLFQHDQGLPQNNSSIKQILFASSVSKMFASSITYPHEVVRTRLHTQSVSQESLVHTRYISQELADTATLKSIQPQPQKQNPKYRGSMQTFKVILLEEGWRGFYKGFSLNLFRTVPASALTILTYEVISSNLRTL